METFPVVFNIQFAVTWVMMCDTGRRVKAQPFPPIYHKGKSGRRRNVVTAVIAQDYLKAVKAFICLQEL